MTSPSRADVLADLDAATVVPDWLADQVRADAAAGRFAAWGRSTVVDENLGSPVLSRELFDELHGLTGLDAADPDLSWPVGNAGLLHVYGYLLSTVDTPFGRKRDRWVDGGVARAFGLPADAFAPWFVTPSARDSTPLERILAVARPFIDDPADGDFTLLWVDEHGPARGQGAGEPSAARIDPARTTLARTVIVRDDDTGAAALLYAVGTHDALSLVTLFPLDWGSSDQGATDWLETLEAQRPRLRYNAVDSRNVASAPLVDQQVVLRNF